MHDHAFASPISPEAVIRPRTWAGAGENRPRAMCATSRKASAASAIAASGVCRRPRTLACREYRRPRRHRRRREYLRNGSSLLASRHSQPAALAIDRPTPGDISRWRGTTNHHAGTFLVDEAIAAPPPMFGPALGFETVDYLPGVCLDLGHRQAPDTTNYSRCCAKQAALRKDSRNGGNRQWVGRRASSHRCFGGRRSARERRPPVAPGRPSQSREIARERRDLLGRDRVHQVRHARVVAAGAIAEVHHRLEEIVALLTEGRARDDGRSLR